LKCITMILPSLHAIYNKLWLRQNKKI
jgi:hypothetical protein